MNDVINEETQGTQQETTTSTMSEMAVSEVTAVAKVATQAKASVTVTKVGSEQGKSYSNIVRAAYDLIRFDKGELAPEGVTGKRSQAHLATLLRGKGVKITRGRLSNLSNGHNNITDQIKKAITEVLVEKGYTVSND